MKNTKRRILSIVLALVMVLTVIPVCAITSFAYEGTGVYISGVEIMSAGTVTNDAIKSGTVTFTAASDSSPAKLTLNNATIKASDGQNIVIYNSIAAPLTIELIGNNTLETVAFGSSSVGAIDTYGSLSLTGSGNLTIKNIVRDDQGMGIRLLSGAKLNISMTGELDIEANNNGLMARDVVTVAEGAGKITLRTHHSSKVVFYSYASTPITLPEGYKMVGSTDENETDTANMSEVNMVGGYSKVGNYYAKSLVIYNPNAKSTDITEIKTTPTKIWTPADYSVQVKGRAIKFQFIDANGNTWTYPRENATIISYDKDGNVLESSESRELAYEVWTVTATLPAGDYTVKAKYALTGWQTNPEKDYKLTVTNKASTEVDVISAELANTSGPAGRVTATVITGAEVQKVQLAMNGTTNTSANAVINPDGTKTFTLTAFTVKGENEIAVKVKYDNQWHDNTTLTYTAE